MMFKTFEEMCAARVRLDAAEKTLLCFQCAGVAYAVVAEIAQSWVKRDRMSSKRGGWMKARIRLHESDRQDLQDRPDCIRLGTVAALTAAYEAAYMAYDRKACAQNPKRKPKAKAPHNDGWMYECAVTERLAGQTWEPDSVPFWKAPDVVIDGVGYQVKGDGAEWFTEQTINQAATEMGW